MTCLDCGGAGILLDFDTSTYDLCHCREQIAENANCSDAIATGSREGHDSEAWRGAKQARAARSASPPENPNPTYTLYDALAEDDDILDETAPSNSQDKSHDPTR